MADFERDSIEPGSLQLATEMAFNGLVDRKALGKLLHKSASFALLETDVHEGYRRFPHTEISHHFLATALIRTVANGVRSRVLRRGALTSDFLSIFGEEFITQSADIARKFVENLEPILHEEVAFDRLADNAASLLITSLCHEVSDRIRTYADISLLDAVLFGVVAAARFERVKIQRLDAREAELAKVEFVDCEVAHLTVDNTTRFGITVPSVHQLLVTTEAGQVEEMFGRAEIAVWLQAHSAKPNSTPNLNANAVRLFDRVCRVMLRQHMIKEHPTDAAAHLLRERYWKEIEGILFERKIIDRIPSKPSKGLAATFVRMKDPYRLLVHKADDAEVQLVWDKVGAIPVR
jgi:hypothetical protein